MRLEQLYYFVTVAELHSLTAASEALYVTQQALSTSIKNLEQEYRTTLFIRNPRGVSLSEDGKYVYRIAKQILNLKKEMDSYFLPEEEEEMEQLRISISKNTKDNLFTKIVSYYYTNYPYVHLDFVTMHNMDVIRTFEESDYDLGVASLPFANHIPLINLPEQVEFVPITISKFSLLTRNDSVFAKNKSLSMRTALTQPIIISAEENAQDDVFHILFRHFSDNPKIIYADSYLLQRQLAADGAGNMLQTVNWPLPPGNVCTVPITDNVEIKTGFLIRKADKEQKLHGFFVDTVIKLLNQP